MNRTGGPDVQLYAQEDIYTGTFKNTQITPTYTQIGRSTYF